MKLHHHQVGEGFRRADLVALAPPVGGVYVAQGAGARPPAPPDPASTPLNERERNAIKELLKRLRDKQDETTVGGGTRLVSNAPAAARITGRLPQDAKLFVDGVVCPLTSATPFWNSIPTIGWFSRVRTVSPRFSIFSSKDLKMCAIGQPLNRGIIALTMAGGHGKLDHGNRIATRAREGSIRTLARAGWALRFLGRGENVGHAEPPEYWPSDAIRSCGAGAMVSARLQQDRGWRDGVAQRSSR